ncbi:MAG: glycosyltransferase family 2 protein [Clostridiales bacterium]|nr:glycosyltransferase family 2 protein [Clostridiales bacterium]
MYTYTIIIPHYNIPHLLERLLRSIPKRTDLQVIVVDDCSPRDAKYKLDALKDNFPVVEFYTTEKNGGGGKARNIGMKYAKGRYLIFSDADDYFTSEFSDILEDYSGSDNYDIIFFNAKSVDSITYQPKARANHLDELIKLSERDLEKGKIALKYLFGEPWCKIIKREIVIKNKIFFDEIPIHNDTFYSYMVGYYAKDIRIDSRIGYVITERSASVSKQLSEEKLIIREKVFSRKNQFLKRNYIPVLDPLMFLPLSDAIKKRNFRLLKLLLIAAKENGYSKFAIFKDYLRIRLKGKLL